jgi:hypothetical protein
MLPDPVDSLTQIARKLNDLRAGYMLTGSVAALFYGRERSTVDVDIVIDMTKTTPEALVEILAPEHFLDIEMVRDCLKINYMFNALPMTGGPKIDFIPLKPDTFEQIKFQRRVTKDWHGTPVSVITAIDLVLSKLEWAKSSMSERQLADVRGIMSFGEVVEDEYFHRWVRLLGLEDVVEASRTTGYDA